MALILHIETATPVCSVSIARDGNTLAERTTTTGNDHMSVITLHIRDAAAEAGIALSDLDAVAVSSGPGSYTGLRIGASTAKGICHALGKSLIAIPTLEAMVSGMQELYTGEDVQFCPLMDARRMEVYTLVAGASGKVISAEQAYVIEEPYFGYVPKAKKTVFFGSGLEKAKPYIGEGNIADERYFPSSLHLHKLSFSQYKVGNFVDLAYFEPDYGKEFYTPAKK